MVNTNVEYLEDPFCPTRCSTCCSPPTQQESCIPEQTFCPEVYCDPCQQQSFEDCCEPSDCCPEMYGMCSPYRKRRYIQPPRRESCKPIIKYQRPCVPMTSETIYRNSFESIDSQTAACCRLPPVRPTEQLRTPCGQFEDDTIMKLSFQPYNCMERTKPIIPFSPSLLGNGPMQSMTTQKHDYVPKFQFRRTKCVPRNNLRRECGDFEKITVQQLSFMPPDVCNYNRIPSCKPIIKYQRPNLPMEFETTQKLSYMPVCPSPKADTPWARKAKYCPPSVCFAKDTIAKLSYQPPGYFIDDNTCTIPTWDGTCC